MRVVWGGFALGVIVLQQQAALPGWRAFAWMAGLLVLSGGAVSLSLRRNIHSHAEDNAWRVRLTRVFPRVLCGLVAACVGFGYASWRAHGRLAESLPVALEGRELMLTGSIRGLPAQRADGARFLLDVERIERAGESLPMRGMPHRVQLNWMAQDASGARRPRDNDEVMRDAGAGSVAEIQQAESIPVLESGTRWQLPVKLKRAHGNANFDVRDSEATLFARGIRATGYVSAPESAIRLAQDASSIASHIDRWRARLRTRIDTVLEAAPHRGVVIALANGAQDDIDDTDWQTMRATGTSHLVAISGLHIGFVAGAIAWFAAWLWRQSVRVGFDLPLRLPAPYVAACAGTWAAAMHAALAGFNVPAQRVLWMTAAVAIAMLSGRTLIPSMVLAWALGVVLVVDPWAVLAPGFWLSFGAVAAILFALSGESSRRRPHDADDDHDAFRSAEDMLGSMRPTQSQRVRARCVGVAQAFTTRIRGASRVQFAVTIALAPLTVWWFSQIPLIGPAANALAIPWVSVLVTPAVLLGVALPAPLDAWAFQTAHTLVALMMRVLASMSGAPWAVWYLPRPGGWAMASAIAGVAWALAPRGWPLRHAAPLAWLPLLMPPPAGPPAGFRLTALDVGQGTAVLVQTAHHALLFDAGPGPESTHAGERVVVPFLRAAGVSALDLFVVSHADSDHAGGAPAVFDAIDVRTFAAALPSTHPLWSRAAARRSTNVPCAAGQHWRWDGVDFSFLWPDAGPVDGKPNAHCCVLRVAYPEHGAPPTVALIAADIEASTERTLMSRDRAVLASQILVVPHHGSRTSSTEPFLDSVGPRVAIFQVGYRNRFHHPAEGVYARYLARHIPLSRSDDDGAVRVEAREGSIVVERYRDTRRRYWMDAPEH